MGQRFGGAAALVRKSALEWGRSQIGSENYNSRNTTISATETGVVENDWGFRLKDKKKIGFFRYKGTKK